MTILQAHQPLNLNTMDVLSWIAAIAFTALVPQYMAASSYPHGLESDILREGKNPLFVFGKSALFLIGGGLLLAVLLFRVRGYYVDQLEYASAGEEYASLDAYKSIAFTWGLAFPGTGIYAFILCYIAANKLIEKTRKENQQKATIKQSYGAKSWATDTAVRGGNATKELNGIHIGNGWHWNDKGHMLLVGGSGQGKGVNLILPALLSDGFVNAGISVVCLDPKGENAAVAAPHLKQAGYEVHVLNPFGIQEVADLGNSRFNPFDLIDPESDDAEKLYNVLAMALHNRRGSGENSFFDNRCRQYISLYLSYAQFTGAGNFSTVYDWLTLSGDERAVLLSEMIGSENFEGSKSAKAILSRLSGEAAKTEESVFTTVEEAVNVLKSKNLRKSLSASDFDMRTIAQKPTAIFVCVPFEDLEDYAPWVRIFFNFLLRTLTRYYNADRKVLVLLDEFPQLGFIHEVEKSAAVLRGYNVTIWPVVQGLGQLKTLYKDSWETFVGSAIIKHWLSMATDNTTADYIAHRMPDDIDFVGTHADGTPKERIKKLLNTNEVMTFKDMICEISGLSSPVRFQKTPYWKLPFAAKNATKNPFYSEKS